MHCHHLQGGEISYVSTKEKAVRAAYRKPAPDIWLETGLQRTNRSKKKKKLVLRLLFGPEDRYSTLLRNISNLPDYTA
jgi:hypothetical protein